MERADVGTGLLAHQIGEPPRHLAFVRPRKVPEQHVRHDQAEHMVAKEFEPLIGYPPRLTHPASAEIWVSACSSIAGSLKR